MQFQGAITSSHPVSDGWIWKSDLLFISSWANRRTTGFHFTLLRVPSPKPLWSFSQLISLPSPLSDNIQAIFGFFFSSLPLPVGTATFIPVIYFAFYCLGGHWDSGEAGVGAPSLLSPLAPVALLFCLPIGFSCGSVCNQCAWHAISYVLAACCDSRPAEVRPRSVIRCSKMNHLRLSWIVLFCTPQTLRSHERNVATNPLGLCSDAIQSL